jgi:flavorubredoxin
MINTSEIAPDVYRISVFVPEINLQFNHFLIKDDEPMLFHAGMKQMFPLLSEAVNKIIPQSKIRWIGLSHFEVDECGALNDWLQVAPDAKGVCSEACAMLNMTDFAIRPVHAMHDNTVLKTGQYTYRFIRTPHLPHGWDAGLMFEETNRTLLCSDLFHQNGEVVNLTDKDILGAYKNAILEYEKGPLKGYTPYTHNTSRLLKKLAELKPKTLAIMHGSSYNGDCNKALIDLDLVMKEIWGNTVMKSSKDNGKNN